MLSGNYTIGKVIGAGAMGDVFKATNTRTSQQVAIKRLKSALVKRDPTVLERFIREGEALRQLNHPNIVKMLDTFSDGDAHYIVMEYVAGGDLHALLEAEGPLAVKDALRIAIQLADALTRTHFLGIVHRDIKPANILMGAGGVPKLTDFGIAHFAEAQESPTQTGMVVGTYAYLSPEACMGMPLDARSDIWAFGVVLYEMLTGQRPFTSASVGQLIVEIMNKPFPDPQELNPAIPDDLNDLLYRILTKQREARIPSVRLVGAEIEALQKGRSLSTRTPAPAMTDAMFATPTSSTHHNLPHQATPFVGRQTELAELQRLIDDDGVRLITVHGPGGMGKSRLAIEAAHTRRENYPDGAIFVELAPLSDPAAIPATLADAAGFSLSEGKPAAEQVLAFLANKRMLIILDNFEHIMGGRDFMAEILKAAPHVTLIATSRERLKLTGETVFTLGGMDFPAWQTPEDALTYSAVQLFLQAAQRTQFDFELAADALDHLAGICQLVQGTPLGIILAAGWVDALPLAEIEAEISASIDFLETELTDIPDRQRSIRAAFEYSWRLLSDDERAAFSRLSVFRGSFTHRAAKEVAGANIRMLTNLAAKSLLGRNPASGRFEVHELLRQIAAEHLQNAAAIRRAHAEHYLTLTAASWDDLRGGAQLEALAQLEPDFENIKAAWEWAHSDETLIDNMRQAVRPVLKAFSYRNRDEEVLPLFAATQEAYADAKGAAARHLWATLFMSIARHNRIPAYKHLENTRRAQAISQEMGDRALELGTEMGFMADALHNHQQVEEALSYAQNALVIAEEIGDLYEQSEIYYLLGIIQVGGGHIQASLAHTKQSNDLKQQIGDLFGQVATLTNLGTITGYTRDFDTTAMYYEQSYALAKKLGNLTLSLVAASNLGFHSVRIGSLDDARAYIQEARELQKRINTTVGVSDFLYIPRGSLAFTQRHYEQVLTIAAPTLARDEPPLNAQVKAALLTMSTFAEYALGNHEAAKKHLRRTAKDVPPGNRFALGAVLRGLIPFMKADATRAVELFSLHYEYVQMASETMEFNPVLLDLRAELKDQLGEEAFSAAWQRGKRLDLHSEVSQTINEVLGMDLG